MKKIFLTVISIALLGASNALAQTPTLPDPNLEVIPGETIATQYDDFFAYAVDLNDKVFPDDGWDKVKAGTGGLDLLLYTGAGTNNRNQNAGAGDAFDFEDPMSAPAGNATFVSGTWGIGDQDNGPVTVDNLYDYLTSTFGPDVSIPVFYLDMNQEGGDPDLFISAKVSIVDPNTFAEIAYWGFDSSNNGLYTAPTAADLANPALDPTKWVYAPGNLDIGDPGTGDFPIIDENRGSGKPDFIAFAPDMDLSNYLGQGYLFRADFYLSDLNNGFEELFLTGRFGAQCTENCNPTVPEPTSMLLLGSGLVGMVGLRKKKKS